MSSVNAFNCSVRSMLMRYKPSDTITKAELEWLAKRVEYQQALTERLCYANIASYLDESFLSPHV